jgi:hypothetical protein
LKLTTSSEPIFKFGKVSEVLQDSTIYSRLKITYDDMKEEVATTEQNRITKLAHSDSLYPGSPSPQINRLTPLSPNLYMHLYTTRDNLNSPKTPVLRNKSTSHQEDFVYQPKENSKFNTYDKHEVIDVTTDMVFIQQQDGSNRWINLDSHFLATSKSLFNYQDIQIFWEMVRAIIELPDLASHMKSNLKKTEELSRILKRPEYSLLWTISNSACLPKDILVDLVASAYTPKIS